MSDEPDCPLKNAEHTDASLTARGRQQALAVGAKLINTQPVPEVAFVSPLKRTLLTAFIALRRASLHVPILVHEGIRERHGVHLCDMRSPRENIELLFPGVDFSDIPYGPDALFATEREKETEVADRGRAFFEELLKRAESCIAVFSHSSLLYNTINRAFEHTSPNGM